MPPVVRQALLTATLATGIACSGKSQKRLLRARTLSCPGPSSSDDGFGTGRGRHQLDEI